MKFEDFVDYLDRTWVGKDVPSRGGRPAHRRQPLYGHDTWNVFQEMQKNEPILTNNALESWNRNWNKDMGSKPNMWRVISGFVHKESETKRILVSNAAGQDLNTNTGRKSLVRGHYERIARIVQQFSALPPKEYINIIAHELSVH